ncbi:SHOCT domain-containing protein [Homoserinibacter sp. GY 40078]|uniref:SHOCT domain-containing protein n=1 Tax=Homoserinibacter sp. GY 40078 TaxID=2603275 RepID=UPI00165072D6|nr:SHOCT domain-containing protein [Homoserinibacter sp. GY 40078]
MSFLNNVWDLILLMFWIFAFIAYLFAIFSIIGDLFRDNTLNGWWKALWIVFLIFLPFLTALVYLIARGRGMAERSQRQADAQAQIAEKYIRDVAGTATPTDEIAKAKALLDAGAISQAEFESLKAKALS